MVSPALAAFVLQIFLDAITPFSRLIKQKVTTILLLLLLPSLVIISCSAVIAAATVIDHMVTTTHLRRHSLKRPVFARHKNNDNVFFASAKSTRP